MNLARSPQNAVLQRPPPVSPAFNRQNCNDAWSLWHLRNFYMRFCAQAYFLVILCMLHGRLSRLGMRFFGRTPYIHANVVLFFRRHCAAPKNWMWGFGTFQTNGVACLPLFHCLQRFTPESSECGRLPWWCCNTTALFPVSNSNLNLATRALLVELLEVQYDKLLLIVGQEVTDILQNLRGMCWDCN